MDSNLDGVITNIEMGQYYAQLAVDYGNDIVSLQNNSIGSIVVASQAANVYSANDVAYSAPHTSLLGFTV